MPGNPSDRKAQYQLRKKQGLCPRCGIKVRKSSPFKYCDDCRSYFRDYGNAISKQVSVARKKKYALRKKLHQCPRCGKQLGKRYTKIMCPVCLSKANQ
jgi:Zn finger protein HypA/HybF involved in hydrogenase expression